MSAGPSPVPRLHYDSPTFLDTSLSREAPPAQLGQTPPHAVPHDMVLQISHPSPCPTNTLGLPPAEAVAVQACTRFRKHLLDLDGLWHLFQDFNVAPYLLWLVHTVHTLALLHPFPYLPAVFFLSATTAIAIAIQQGEAEGDVRAQHHSAARVPCWPSPCTRARPSGPPARLQRLQPARPGDARIRRRLVPGWCASGHR